MLILFEILGGWMLLAVIAVTAFHQAVKFGRQNDPTYN